MFESDWTMKNVRDLNNTELITLNLCKSILLGALHIYNKERIHDKLEPFNVVCNFDGIAKLFGATCYRWTPQNEPQKLLDLGSLLSKCICKNKPDMSAYEKENPVACDIINKLVMKSMTLPRLMRHNYMWDSEATMKFFYDVTEFSRLEPLPWLQSSKHTVTS
ncbi:hypothetical protein Tco_1568890 [Tanacetum coccineum]